MQRNSAKDIVLKGRGVGPRASIFSSPCGGKYAIRISQDMPAPHRTRESLNPDACALSLGQAGPRANIRAGHVTDNVLAIAEIYPPADYPPAGGLRERSGENSTKRLMAPILANGHLSTTTRPWGQVLQRCLRVALSPCGQGWGFQPERGPKTGCGSSLLLLRETVSNTRA